MSIEGFAVAVTRDDTTWRCSLLADDLIEDVAGVIAALRRLGASGAAFALVDVDDEFFYVVRPRPSGAAAVISDATAALDYDVAAEVLDLIDVPQPDDEEDADPYAEGDLAILGDLGVSEEHLRLIVDDDDLYPDEQLQMVADACGFGDQFHAAVDRD